MYNLFTTIVLGGNVIYPRGCNEFDFDFLGKISQLISDLLAKGQKVIIVPGGLGGQLYFDNARKLNCSEAELNYIGTKTIEIASIILTRHFRETLTKYNSTRVARFADIDVFKNEVNFYEVSVVGFTLSGATTSDSLAALISADINSTLYFIKNEKSKLNITDKVRDINNKTVSISKIRQYCNDVNYVSHAGKNPLDLNAFKIISQSKLTAYVIYKEHLLLCNLKSNDIDKYKIIE